MSPADRRDGGGLARRAWWLGVALVALAALGSAVRFTVRDHLLVTAAFYYAMSPALIACLLLGAALSMGAARRWPLALAVAVSSLAVGAVAVRVQGGAAGACGNGRPGLRVLAWNVWGGRDPAAIANLLARFDADVIALVEARTDAVRDVAFWRGRFPAHQVHPLEGSLLVLSRQPLRDVTVHDLGRRGHLAVARTTLDGRALELAVVDFPSDPTAVRRPFVQHPELLRPVAPGAVRVVLGDFNTPRDSVWFAAYDGLYTHAFDAAGRGWRPTWPAWFPVVDLDHVWVAGAAATGCSFVVRTGLSDHRPVVADLDWGA